MRGVGVIHLVTAEVFIPVGHRIRTNRSEREAKHDLARVQRLAGAGYAARLIKLRYAIGQHFRVHAQIADAALQQQCADRVRHGADANLQAGPILNLGGNAARHGAVDFVRSRIR